MTSTTAAAPAAWKMGMLVLLILYPLVFVFDMTLAPPLEARGTPLWLSLFVSNVTCVVLLGFLVPWVSRRFAWWLAPQTPRTLGTDLAGAGVLLVLYGCCLVTFAWVSTAG